MSMVGYMAIVYALLSDIFVFGEKIGKVELAGCTIVILITLSMGLMRMRRESQAKGTSQILQESKGIDDKYQSHVTLESERNGGLRKYPANNHNHSSLLVSPTPCNLPGPYVG